MLSVFSVSPEPVSDGAFSPKPSRVFTRMIETLPPGNKRADFLCNIFQPMLLPAENLRKSQM